MRTVQLASIGAGVVSTRYAADTSDNNYSLSSIPVNVSNTTEREPQSVPYQTNLILSGETLMVFFSRHLIEDILGKTHDSMPSVP